MGLKTKETSGGSKGGRPPGSRFFQFHAVFGKIWQNRMIASPGRIDAHLGEILYPPLETVNQNITTDVVL